MTFYGRGLDRRAFWGKIGRFPFPGLKLWGLDAAVDWDVGEVDSLAGCGAVRGTATINSRARDVLQLTTGS